MFYLTRRKTFNAAHRLHNPAWTAERNAAVFGKCNNANWHGHNYVLYVTVAGQPDPGTGFVMDAKVLSDLVEERVVGELDHRNLNLDVEWLARDRQPTTENIVAAIWQRLEPAVAAAGGAARLHCVRLYETENIYAEYYGPGGQPRP